MGHVINWFNANKQILYLDVQTGVTYTEQTLAQQSWAAQAVKSEFMDLTP